MRRCHLAARTSAVALTAAALLGSVSLPAFAAGSAASHPVVARETLNVRSGPGAQFRVIGILAQGQQVKTTGAAARGWTPVRFGSETGYVLDRWVTDRVGRTPAAEPAGSIGDRIATEELNVRSGPEVGASTVGTLAQGDRVEVTGKSRDGFAPVRFRGDRRWVSATYLAAASATQPADLGHRDGAATRSDPGSAAVAFARSQLGKPYQFGAVGPNAYDCSGLTLKAWASVGVTLPRTSQSQYAAGAKIARADLQPGDLVFFYGPSPDHVGVYVGNGQMIAAPRPGKVVQYTRINSMPYAGATRPSLA